MSEVGLPTLIPLWIAGVYVAAYVAYYFPQRHTWGADAHAYWLTAHQLDLYRIQPGQPDSYLYSPVFAQVIHPIANLPWTAFLTIWMVLETAAFVWMLAPLGWRWAVPLLLICSVEIGLGNIFGFLAVALVLGLRHPTAWAVPILTKVTPGLCLIWFAARHEWGRLGRACAATALIAGVSLLIDSDLWPEWIRLLFGYRGAEPTMPIRLVAAAVLVVVSARTSRSWLMAPAFLLACPLLHGFVFLTVLAAIPRLRNNPPRLDNGKVGIRWKANCRRPEVPALTATSRAGQ